MRIPRIGWLWGVLALLASGGFSAPASAGVTEGPNAPAAVYRDPPKDVKHPADSVILHIPSQGVVINGLAYLPEGAGPHPVFVLCHGLPGNEKNLDLAQAVRRAGWVAVTFNYRGSWGSPGNFSFLGTLQDTAAVLAYLRDPKQASRLRLDPARMVLAGHSMGGWVTASTAAVDRGLAGAVLISAWDPARAMSHAERIAFMADDMETLAGVTADGMAAEIEAHASDIALRGTAAGLKDTRLLVLTSDDGLGPAADALVQAIRTQGGRRVTAQHVATNHVWSDSRIELETRVIRWLQFLNGKDRVQ